MSRQQAYRDEIDSCYTLFLGRIEEHVENGLRLILLEAKVGGVMDDIVLGDARLSGMRAIEHTRGCRIWEVVFDSYVSYVVLNESYTCWDERQVWEGRQFRTYTRSHFLDYLGRDSFATDEYPGPFTHFGICCENHIIHVASMDEPRIRRMDYAGQTLRTSAADAWAEWMERMKN